MAEHSLVEETLGYVTAEDSTNTDERYLVYGSHDVLVDQNRKTKSRAGFTRLGAANTALTPPRSGVTWSTSTGTEIPLRLYDDELEGYLGTIDGTIINAWTRLKNGWSTTAKMRFTTWWDTAEQLDVLLMVIADDNIYEYNGAIAVVSSVTGTTITKTGTATFGENRFYSTRDKTLVNVRTGTEYTYTAGEGTTTLTGITDTTGIIAGDILVQKFLTRTDKPTSGRINNTIFTFENQVCVGSETDEEVFISKSTDPDDLTFSTPRLPGEGALLNLENPTTGFGIAGGVLVISGGRNDVFKVEYTQITVGTALTESLKIKKLQTGVDQGAINQECMVPIGNSLAFISHEPTLRIIQNPDDLEGVNPKTYSNPIKPDFDAIDFSDSFGIWFKNALSFNVPDESKQLILEFTEDANGKVRRFWQPPQTLPVSAPLIIDGALHSHSNSIPETYRLYYGGSDAEYDGIAPADKLPIHSVAVFAYRTFGKRDMLKTLDEYYSEGQIKTNTDVMLRILYDFGGSTQVFENVIQGDDTGITLEENILASMGQSPMGLNPLGGSSFEPEDSIRYQVIFEIAKEDFYMIQEIYEMQQVDGYFSVIARGPNAKLSPRRDTAIRR